MSQTQFKLCTQADAEAVKDFLWSLKDEFHFSERESTEEITETLFQEGGILVDYQNEQMVALPGYFLGDPAKDYQNKELGFTSAKHAEMPSSEHAPCDLVSWQTRTGRAH